MSHRKREEERIERIIRGLLRLPENKRCINCNLLGPQYVCTTFWTFVCTSCSGIHREFNHRVKSVSMAKFNSEEVSALQAGGNERAKQIYFKAWDPERNSHPDGSNIHRLRDFIKHVYVDRRYTGERGFQMPGTAKQGDKSNFYERRPIDKSGLGSREDFYERRSREDFYERRTYDRSSPSGRGDRSYRNYIDDRSNRHYFDDKDYRNYIEDRSPSSIYENGRFGSRRSRSSAHFEIVDDRIRDDGYGRRSRSGRIYSSDTSMSPEPQRKGDNANPMASEPQRITEKASPPVLRPLKDIMGENNPTPKVGDPPKADNRKDADGTAYDQLQKTESTGARATADLKEEENKAASASNTAANTVEFSNKLEPPNTAAKTHTETSSSLSLFESSTAEKASNPPTVNSVESLLFELSVVPVDSASELPGSSAASPTVSTASPAAPTASSAAPAASSAAHVVSPTGPVAPSAALASSSAAPVVWSNAPKISSTTHVTSSDGAIATESASKPNTSATPSATASSPVVNTEIHPSSSASSISQVTEVKQVQTTQQHQPSASNTGNNSSTGQHGTSTLEGLFDQPWPSLPAATAQEAPGNASADQSSQAVSKAAQTTSSPGDGSKSTGRKELPAELFTFRYPSYPTPVQNWQFRPPHGMGYGMQYTPPMNVAAFPSSAKSRNPFDLVDDPKQVQGATVPPVASFHGGLPQMSYHAGSQPRPSPFASVQPPDLRPYMTSGGYAGQQLSNNMPNPRPQGTGNFGGGVGGDPAFTSLNPVQHSSVSYSSNSMPGAPNSFPSAGGNPFG